MGRCLFLASRIRARLCTQPALLRACVRWLRTPPPLPPPQALLLPLPPPPPALFFGIIAAAATAAVATAAVANVPHVCNACKPFVLAR